MTYSTNSFTASNGGAPQSASYADTGTTPGSGAEILRQGSNYYDTARSDIQQTQRFDVTDQIIRYNELYGGSDNTAPSDLAASRSLNYAKSPTMQQAQRLKLTAFPFTFDFTGAVGLFGAENVYIRVDLDLDIIIGETDFEYDDYTSAKITYGFVPPYDLYRQAEITVDADPPPPGNTETLNDLGRCQDYLVNPEAPVSDWIILTNCYIPAAITTAAPFVMENSLVSIDLKDLGVNNIYIDNWFETMLYTRDRRMWGYDKMYLHPKDTFYIGFHARNTRRLPYNVKCTVGEEYVADRNVKQRELVPFTNYYD